MIKLTNLVTAAMILGTPSLTNYSPAHNPVAYHTHVAPHYRPGEPVRNTLKFLFCPRCHRQYPIGTVCSCSGHSISRGCESGRHYVPREPVRNTLKFIFCPRCHRQYPIGTVCSCSTHTHVNHYINPASQTRTEVIIRQVSPTAVHREIYFSLP